MSVSLALRQFVNRLNASPGSHHVAAATALSYDFLLTDGERWFLQSTLQVAALSGRLLARLHEICAKIERLRP